MIGFAAVATCLALHGCTVGPDYHPNRPHMPDGWTPVTTQPAPGASVVTFEQAQVAQWWNSFRDPSLTALVEKSLLSNLDLKQAVSRIRQARAARGTVAAGFWPSAQAGGHATRGRSSGGASGSGQESSLFLAGLDAAWELDVFGGVRRGVEAADADIAAAVEDQRGVMVTLTAEVALNYLDVRTFQERLAIARRNLEAQQHSAKLTRLRHRGGLASDLDVANADADVAGTQAQIPTLEANLQLTVYSLGVLLGESPTAVESDLAATKPMPTVPPQVPIGLPSDLLRRRPDIRAAEARFHSATARIGVAEADLFPKFSLTGSMGVQGNKLASLSNWSSRFWSAGPSVTWEIFDAGRILSNMEVQNALQEQALLTYRQTILTALQDVQSALALYSREQQRTQFLIASTAANRKALDLSKRLYAEGQIDFLSVLIAQRSLLAAEDTAAQSQRNIAADLVALYKALGGGWEDRDGEIANPAPATTRP